MSVKAKFTVTKVSETEYSDGKGVAVSLSPVIEGSDENKEFYKWTPGGQILLSTINPEAANQFVEGKEMYVTFEDATPEAKTAE